MPYQSFMPSPPQPVYFAPDFATGIRSRRENALENRKLEYLMQNNALTQQSAQEKTQREQEKFAEEKRKTGLQESDKVREWQAGMIAQSSPDQIDTPEKMGMLFGGVDKIHQDISNLFHQNPQQAYQIIKSRFGKQQEPVKPITLEEQYTDLGKREETKAKYAKPTEIYGPVKQGLDEAGKSIFFKISKTDPSDIQIVKGVTPEPKKGMKIYDREGNLMVDTSGGAGVAGMTKPAQTAVQKDLIGIRDRMARLNNIMGGFKKEYQTFSGKFKAGVSSLKEYLGSDISPEDKQYLSKFSIYKQDALENINKYIKEITGAQMSEKEADRLRKAMPDPGDGILDGDSPTTFYSKLMNAYKITMAGSARYHYYLNQGLGGQKIAKMVKDGTVVSLDEMIKIMDERYETLQIEIGKEAAMKQIKEEFGL